MRFVVFRKRLKDYYNKKETNFQFRKSISSFNFSILYSDQFIQSDHCSLMTQILLHHLIHPQVDAAVELGALREIQPKDQRTIGLFGRE